MCDRRTRRSQFEGELAGLAEVALVRSTPAFESTSRLGLCGPSAFPPPSIPCSSEGSGVRSRPPPAHRNQRSISLNDAAHWNAIGYTLIQGAKTARFWSFPDGPPEGNARRRQFPGQPRRWLPGKSVFPFAHGRGWPGKDLLRTATAVAGHQNVFYAQPQGREYERQRVLAGSGRVPRTGVSRRYHFAWVASAILGSRLGTLNPRATPLARPRPRAGRDGVRGHA